MREHEWIEIEGDPLSGRRCASEDATNGANKPSRA